MSTVTVESSRFGTLEIEAGAIIEFPAGLIGLGGRRWAVVTKDDDGAFSWLHSLDDPALALPVTNPWAFFADYEVALSDADSARFESDQVAVWVTVRAGAELADFSANLRAPILIADGQGYQVINEAQHAPVRAPLFPDAQAGAAAA
ncbi:MAG TPA: flagellar assembly protein FliW [Solirubrobacteraceae bacterium]|nr:flagellar assembly protein FliW [Solirubrobacteraceae bacterium]